MDAKVVEKVSAAVYRASVRKSSNKGIVKESGQRGRYRFKLDPCFMHAGSSRLLRRGGVLGGGGGATLPYFPGP